MKTHILFESWWSDNWRYHHGEKASAEAAWNAALESAEKEPENDPKRIGVEILERALREAEVMTVREGLGYDRCCKTTLEELLQELRE